MPAHPAPTTPPACTADFCLLPIGTATPSVSSQIASVQRLIRQSGVKYSMHSAGTTLEGSWDAVMGLIGQCHVLLHQQGVVRIQSDIRVGSRTDKKQTMEEKVSKVEQLLAGDGGEEGMEEPGTRHTKDTTNAAPNATTGVAETSAVVPD